MNSASYKESAQKYGKIIKRFMAQQAHYRTREILAAFRANEASFSGDRLKDVPELANLFKIYLQEKSHHRDDTQLAAAMAGGVLVGNYAREYEYYEQQAQRVNVLRRLGRGIINTLKVGAWILGWAAITLACVVGVALAVAAIFGGEAAPTPDSIPTPEMPDFGTGGDFPSTTQKPQTSSVSNILSDVGYYGAVDYFPPPDTPAHKKAVANARKAFVVSYRNSNRDLNRALAQLRQLKVA